MQTTCWIIPLTHSTSKIAENDHLNGSSDHHSTTQLLTPKPCVSSSSSSSSSSLLLLLSSSSGAVMCQVRPPRRRRRRTDSVPFHNYHTHYHLRSYTRFHEHNNNSNNNNYYYYWMILLALILTTTTTTTTTTTVTTNFQNHHHHHHPKWKFMRVVTSWTVSPPPPKPPLHSVPPFLRFAATSFQHSSTTQHQPKVQLFHNSYDYYYSTTTTPYQHRCFVLRERMGIYSENNNDNDNNNNTSPTSVPPSRQSKKHRSNHPNENHPNDDSNSSISSSGSNNNNKAMKSKSKTMPQTKESTNSRSRAHPPTTKTRRTSTAANTARKATSKQGFVSSSSSQNKSAKNVDDQKRKYTSSVVSSNDSTNETNKPTKASRRSTPGTTTKSKGFTSLLPPYSLPSNDVLLSSSSSLSSSTKDDRSNWKNSNTNISDDDDEDFVTNGLSSWEEFLGRGNRASIINGSNHNQSNDIDNDDNTENTYIHDQYGPVTDPEQMILQTVDRNQVPTSSLLVPLQPQLPSIQDLFPPDLTNITSSSQSSSNDAIGIPSTVASPRPLLETRDVSSSFLDGVLPVSDLFYRSSEPLFTAAAAADNDNSSEEEHDDEELPFSAEQSDSITSDENKVRVRHNMIPTVPDMGMDGTKRGTTLSSAVGKRENENIGSDSIIRKDKNRKMIRRGMEMLVGGIPIQADPPQRSVQISYNQPPKDGSLGYDWASTISLNTRDFGPLLHTESIDKVSEFERGLFCEFFCHSAIKWDVCPNDLRQIVNVHRSATTKLSKDLGSIISVEEHTNNETDINGQEGSVISMTEEPSNELLNTQEIDELMFNETENDGLVGTSGEIRFEIGVTREELETGSGKNNGSEIFRSVFRKAFDSILQRAIKASTTRHIWDNVVVDVPTLTLQETDDGYTSVCAEFRIDANITSTDAERELRLSKVGSTFSRSMDDGGFALAIAAAAKDEIRWPKSVRNRVVEECLFQDDDGDESTERLHWTRTESPVMYDREVGLVLPARIGDGRSSLYKGGGTDGVFHDFSAMNVLNAPYSGEIGLRLVDAVTARAKQRHPKVIAIGDVHGCIDELQDLLRQCDFRPGDLVVFLGDLVCKGPDSVAVVQMAREIGAIGVRGNHDFEVVRWHQAIKSGVDPPVFGSEHYHIAACLSKADMNWMYSLPWYISSKDLSTLFVHAGFVSGIRLAKQNPRLMMNMRSILPDGTVTSKFFNNWPWARLWDGPQTVLFGHDADRGLQQYEHAIGLDTGCVYGGRLTACILPEKKLVSVSAKRQYFKYRRKHYD